MSETDATPPSAQPDPEESPSDESAQSLESRAKELQTHIQGFGQELQNLAENLEARKRETTILKVMLYTGVVVLMVAFFYSSNALHQAQIKSFETNIRQMQAMNQAHIQEIQAHMQAAQRDLNNEMLFLRGQLSNLERKQSSYYLKEQKLSEILRTLNEAVDPLAVESLELAQKVDLINKMAQELMLEYQRQNPEWPRRDGHILPPGDIPMP